MILLFIPTYVLEERMPRIYYYDNVYYCNRVAVYRDIGIVPQYIII